MQPLMQPHDLAPASTPRFLVVADQDPSPTSMARKLTALYQEGLSDGWIAGRFRDLPLATSVTEIAAAELSEDANSEEYAWDLLSDLLATIDRRLPPGYTVSWHPDYCDTLILTTTEWFL